MIKLRKIIFTGSSLDGICGIQLYFTDNVISPLFESTRKRPTQHLYIDQKQTITAIEARVAYDQTKLAKTQIREHKINQLKFYGARKEVILDSKAYHGEGTLIKQKIPEDMVIIGVYGVKDDYNISSLGFLLLDISKYKESEQRQNI